MPDTDLTEQLRAAGLASRQGAAVILDEQAVRQRCEQAATLERVRGEGIVLAMIDSLRIVERNDSSKALLKREIQLLNQKLETLSESVSALWEAAEKANPDAEDSDG